MPLRTLMTCLTLSPPIFCTSPMSRKRTSTLRLVSLLRSTSSIWVSWNSASPTMVISLSLISMLAEVPLKSKRVVISLTVFSTAFFTSTRLASQMVSKEGMAVLNLRGNGSNSHKAERARCDNRANGSREKRPFAALEHLWHRCTRPNPGARALRGRFARCSGRSGTGARAEMGAGRRQQHHPDGRCQTRGAEDGDQRPAPGARDRSGLDRRGGRGRGLARRGGLDTGAGISGARKPGADPRHGGCVAGAEHWCVWRRAAGPV